MRALRRAGLPRGEQAQVSGSLRQRYNDDVVPALLNLGDVLRVLRNLLRERISVRDLRTIMEALADLSDQTKDSEQLTELVRDAPLPVEFDTSTA